MRNIRNRWIRRVGAVVLVGGLLITGWGLGVTSAAPPSSNPDNPFQAILDKLDQVLGAITGVQEGNHTLRWDTNNPSASRFTTAFTGAVLDKNTGLVWEQAPDGTRRTWFEATRYCVNKPVGAVGGVGGTRGWRLPSVVELASLIDPSLPAPFVPASAFTISPSDTPFYWSATTLAGNPSSVWDVNFEDGSVSSGRTSFVHTWCVRGGMNADAY